MKYLILIPFLAIVSCDDSPPTELESGRTRYNDGGTYVSIRILEKEGRKFAVASSSRGVSIIELHEKP